MKNFIFTLLFIAVIFQLATTAKADIYEYTDESGNIVLTNNPNSIPENKKSNIKILQKQQNTPSNPKLSNDLPNKIMSPEEEARFIDDLRKKGVPEEKIQEWECFFKAKREKNKTWSEDEKKELHYLLISKWKQMVNALVRGDIDTAVSYFSTQTRESYRKLYSAFQKHKTLPAVSQELELSKINMVNIRSSRSAIYEILCIREGKTQSFQLEFLKECDDEWRIKRY